MRAAFILVLLYSFIYYCLACHTTVKQEKGCCTKTIIHNYCKSNDVKSSLIRETSKYPATNKWGDIIIPGPRSKRGCEICTTPLLNCVQLYNDFAMDSGFEVIEFGSEIVNGEEEFNYRKKRQIAVITSPAPPTTIKPHYVWEKPIIEPHYSFSKPIVPPTPKVMNKQPVIKPSPIHTNTIIPAHNLYKFAENKTLDMSEILISFLRTNNYSIVNVTTSVGNFDSVDKFLLAMQNFITSEIFNDLLNFVVEKSGMTLYKRASTYLYSVKPEFLLKLVCKNVPALKSYILANNLNELVSSLTTSEIETIVWHGKLPVNVMSTLVTSMITKHSGYAAVALMNNDITGIVNELKRRGKLEAVIAKFV